MATPARGRRITRHPLSLQRLVNERHADTKPLRRSGRWQAAIESGQHPSPQIRRIALPRTPRHHPSSVHHNRKCESRPVADGNREKNRVGVKALSYHRRPSARAFGESARSTRDPAPHDRAETRKTGETTTDHRRRPPTAGRSTHAIATTTAALHKSKSDRTCHPATGGDIREQSTNRSIVAPWASETPVCVYAASWIVSIWSRRNWAGERWPCRSMSQSSL